MIARARARGLLVATATVASVASARAEDAPVVEVRVIGDRAEALQRIPGSGAIVSEKEIERTQPYDAAEMLRRVPGVVARQEEGGGQRLDIGIRGLDPGRSRRVLVLEDGVPVAINPYAEPDLYYAPPIERMRGIEVVKGSGSILFGPQTIGGVVNFLTLRPPDRQRAAIDVLGGDYAYARVLGMYGDRVGPVRWVVQAFHKKGDGFRDEAFTATDVFGKVAWDTSDTGQLTLKLGVHDDGSRSGDVGLTQAMFETTPRRATIKGDDRLTLRRYEVSLLHEERVGNDTKIKTMVYAYTTSRLWRRQDYTRTPISGQRYDRVVGDIDLPNGAIFLARTNTILDRTYEVAGVEPRVEHRFSTLSVRHTVEAGGRILGESAVYQQRQGETPTSDAGALQLAESHRTYAFAAFVQDRMAFLPTLLATPGLRLEHAAMRREVGRQGGVDVVSSGGSRTTGVIPGVGLTVGTRRLHGFGGLHVGFAPPRVTSAVNPKGFDQALSPEKNIQYEIGARAAPEKWLKAETTLYLTNFQNQLIASTDAGQTLLVNGGRTRHYGVEAQSTFEPGKLLRLGFALDLVARYNFSRAVFVGGDTDGMLLPYAPLHTATTALDFEHATGFGAQVAVAYTGRQFADPRNTVPDDGSGRVGEIPAFANLDLTARYRHKPSGVTVRLLVKNAPDNLYIVSRRPEGIFTGGFREIMVGLRWDWTGKAKDE